MIKLHNGAKMKKFIILFLLFTIPGFARDGKVDDLIRESKQFQRQEYFLQQRAYPFGFIPDRARENAIKQSDKLLYGKKNREALLAQQPEWRIIGPFDVGGRVRSIVHHPTQEGFIYTAAAAGGIWRTTDYGDTWEPIFDHQSAISFGALAIDPNDPDIIYAATGEPSRNVDAYLGNGVYKSTDAGDTWFNIGLTHVGGFYKIYVHPNNSNLIFAGGAQRNQGFYKSTDAGETWKKTFPHEVTDITINPDNENELYIGVDGRGVYFSGNAGESFTERNNGIYDNIGRVSVQMADKNPSLLYALAEKIVVINNSTRRLAEIYKTTNGGSNWSVSMPENGDLFGGNDQGWYDNFIAVSPHDPNLVFAGGVVMYSTKTGGQFWNRGDNFEGGGIIHVDQHCMAFSPIDAKKIYVGNDGGVYGSDNSGNSWFDMNDDLMITQFYAMAIDHSRENRTYGGTQDNGTLGNRNNPDIWGYMAGGDGFRVLVDPPNPNIIYGETPHGNMWKRDFDRGIIEYNKTNGIPGGDAGLWNSPMSMDEFESDFIYHGRRALYVSYDGADSWMELMAARAGQFSAIENSPHSQLEIYAGNSIGELFYTDDGGLRWLNLSEGKLPNRFITDIEVSHKDEKTVFVTYSGYGTQHVYKSVNTGQDWENISLNLPDAPVSAIAVHPENADMLFVATDVGVFASFDGGLSWMPYGRGLPRSPVIDIAFRKDKMAQENYILRIATHGRSMWEIDVPNEVVNSAEITSPAGGEQYISGTSTPIIWYGFENPVKVEVTYNDGIDWHVIASGVTSSSMLWQIPNKESNLTRIKVTSEGNPSQTRMTHIFTVRLRQRGDILSNYNFHFIPYAISYDHNGNLWSTDFSSDKLYRMRASDFVIEKVIDLPGDSLFSGIAMDREKGIIYLHKLHRTDPFIGGKLYTIDTNGTLIDEIESPAKQYPIGLEYFDGKLIIGDRSGVRLIYVYDLASKNVIAQYENPCQVIYGPRGFCWDGEEYFYQVCTDFPASSMLQDAYVIRIPQNDIETEADRLNLRNNSSLINARGIDFDPGSKDLWISDYGGNIYKIAGFDTDAVISVEEDDLAGSEPLIFPNPMREYSNISFEMPKDGSLEIYVTDQMGRKVTGLFSGYLSKGEQKVIYVDASRFSSGVYSVQFLINGIPAASEKLVVVR